jgi:hypothetical protein
MAVSSRLKLYFAKIWWAKEYGAKCSEKEPKVLPSTRRLEASRYRLKSLFLLCTDSIEPSSFAAPLVEGGQSSLVLSSLFLRKKC